LVQRIWCLAGIIGALVLLIAGCDGLSPEQRGLRCVSGEERECGRTLGEHDDVLTCLHGVQRCEGGVWGECVAGTLRTFTASTLTTVSAALRTLALSEPVNCEYSPCDPYCRNFLESPEEGITTILGGGNGVAWLMGSMANLPKASTEKGMADVCATGSDCQLNSYCKFPETGDSCEHSKCAVGEALADDCDPCVADICSGSPECCQQPDPDPCVHDPCAVGTKLKSDCSSCTTKICASIPECCSDTWSSTCVAAVATICEQTCGCCAGEQGYSDRCYNLETDGKAWASALSTCQTRTATAAWNLVSIADQAENDFVESLNGSEHTWIGIEQGDNATENQWRWTSGSPSGVWLESTGVGMYDNFASGEPDGSDDCTRMNANEAGTWDATSCTNSYDFLCEGPPECIDGTPPPAAACEHDPCHQGLALAPQCDSCVTEICDAMPSCCTTAWTAACVAEVADTCGNTCGCATGQVVFDGHCYAQEETDRTWSAARTACQAYGAGWDIVSIADGSENTFVNGNVIDASETWIGFNDITTEGTWVWASGQPTGIYVSSGTSTTTAINYASSWKYRANNVDPGATWTALSFNDTAWSTGTGQLGFGDGDEATAFVKNGPSYYFRKTFTLAQLPTSASLSVLYDDGYVAYINGVEVAREAISNIAHAQYASGNVENAVETGSIAISSLVVGTNVLAVLVKTRNANDTDLSFDATLSVTTPLPTGGIYQNFVNGEPSGDDCVHYRTNKAGNWADASCTASKDSVCEGPYQNMTETGPRFLRGNGEKTAIPKGDIWKHLTNGSNPGATWNGVDFDDSAWPQAPAELGFGDSDEETAFTAANPSYYFRRELEIEKFVTGATLTLVYDDGFVAYVNGHQVAKKNVSSAAHSANASSSSATDNAVYVTEVDADSFVVGKNVIAVMVKNASGSGDLSFDLQLDVTLEDEPPTTATWSEACVEQVATVCGAVCDEAHSPPLETGVCTPWYPHETSAACTGIDLSVGLACEGTIPVCNHGNTEVPAGIRLVHFPADSQDMPTCTPNLNHPQMKECFTQEPIPAGACVSVAGCPGLEDSREIMINPPGTAHVDECHCDDNWSIYQQSQCQAPLCSGGTSVATLTTRAVDIIIIIDNSGSMGGEIEAVQDRINQDLSDISSSGIDYRVIMMSRYGDVDVAKGISAHPICVSLPMGGNSCVDASNETLVNNPPDFYHYSVDVGSLDAWCKVLSSWNTADEYGVAPTGLNALLRPNAFKEFLVITDDRINCSYGGHTFNDNSSAATGTSEAAEFDGVLLALSPEHFGTAQKRNYVWHSIVGLVGNGTTPWPASQPIKTGQCSPGSESAGTGHQALSILTGGLRYPSCQNDDFDAMFQALSEEVIEGAALSCSFEVSNVGFFDPAKTSMVFTSGDDSDSIAFERVGGEDDCDDHQFYYVDEDTIELCPEACDELQDDSDGRISLEVGCQGFGHEEETYTERYHAVCPDGARPQWGFFAYETETPADSKIEFSVRAAPTEEELADATPELWATAAAESTSEVCSMSGPEPCPIDMFEHLAGYPAAHFAWLDLEVKLIPATSGAESPVLLDWRFTYSCLPSE
jgi:hypothetical protein